MPRISVVGCGHLGVTYAACLAEQGFTVLGLDVDDDKVAELNMGRVPFFEPGLEELTVRNATAGRIVFSSDPALLASADVHFITVGTPASENGTADLAQLYAAVGAVVSNSASPGFIIGKSTVPVGTCEAVRAMLPPGWELVWSPEFLREGHAVDDVLRPDRIVVGTAGDRATAMARMLHREQIEAGVPFIVTDFATAELIKSSANAFLAMKISFVNAVADLCARSGADVVRLGEALGYDKRIGAGALSAGVGYGGGCLPKDVRAFRASSAELGVELLGDLLDVVARINTATRDRLVELVRAASGGQLDGLRVAALGVSFKPGSDDIRESPAVDVVRRLVGCGAKVRVHDPVAMGRARREEPELDYADTLADALVDADVLVLLTEWPEFVNLDPDRVGGLVRVKLVVDGRNALPASVWRSAGWTYVSVGR